MTTLQQGDLPADREILRAVSQHNSVDCFGLGNGACTARIRRGAQEDAAIRPKIGAKSCRAVLTSLIR